jgi:hypothetical protein
VATNTFSTLKEGVPRPRDPTLYTWRIPVFAAHPWMNGTLAMTGWIRDSGGVPQQRKVVLLVWPWQLEVATTVSDPTNLGNNYFFNGLQDLSSLGMAYSISVHNENLSTAPRIKDNRIPV